MHPVLAHVSIKTSFLFLKTLSAQKSIYRPVSPAWADQEIGVPGVAFPGR
jgi:hypothetical protein